MTLAKMNSEYRKSHGFSQRQMGAQCGLSTGYISLIEKEVNPQTGKQMIPTLNVLNKIAKGMNMTIDELFSVCDDMPVNTSESETESEPSFTGEQIGHRIKECRERIGITQTDLANSIGELKQTIYKYESGFIENIPIKKLVLIAEHLKVSPGYLMGWEEHPDQKEKPAPKEGDKLSLEIMNLFFSLPEEKQREALHYLRYLAESEGRK